MLMFYYFCFLYGLFKDPFSIETVGITYDGKMTDGLRIENDLDGSCRGIIEVLSRHLPGGTEENHKGALSGLPMSRPRFEQSTSRI
jgi:hypothetical protein